MESEIELARKRLKEDLEKKEKEAEERIEEILSKENMEFCSKCKRKIDDRVDWAGKCLHEGCDNLICNTCWIVEKKRYCREHVEEVKGLEEEGKEKKFFGKEEKPEELKVTEPVDSDKNKIGNITNAYLDLLKDRFKQSIPDWTPEEYLEDPRGRIEIGDEEMDVRIFTKHLLKEEDKLKILVRPVYGTGREDLESVLNDLTKNLDVYTIAVLIGDNCSAEAIDFVANKFDHQRVSLFLIQPTQNLKHFDKKPITKLYSMWFNSGKPKNFIDLIKSLSEKVSGRDVVKADKVGEAFGLEEADAASLLKTCKALEIVEDTNSFFFKD